MEPVGQVQALWRYPVKSMRGEALQEAFIGYAGVYGDRLYAFRSPDAPAGFPYLTGRELPPMLLHQPYFRDKERSARPSNLAEARALDPGLSAVAAAPEDMLIDVETPEGEVLAIDDPALRERLRGAGGALSLLRSDRAMADCRPVSLISNQTVRDLGAELGMDIDPRRFRANIYLDVAGLGAGGAAGFVEDGFVGRSIRIGDHAVIAVLERDPRCKMITLDPDSGIASPAILRQVARTHDGKAGVYGAVLIEGVVRPGDPVMLLD